MPTGPKTVSGFGVNDVAHRVVMTSLRSVTWSLWRWVRKTARNAPGPRQGAGRPQEHATAGVEEEVARRRAHQRGGSGPVGGRERTAAAQDHYLHVDHSSFAVPGASEVLRRTATCSGRVYDNIGARAIPSGPEPGRYPGPVPFYREQVVPRLVALTCGAKGLAGLRARTAAGLDGPCRRDRLRLRLQCSPLPAEVEEVLAVEPSATAFRMAGRRLGASAGPGATGRRSTGSPCRSADASCDAALCTFALCTIPDVGVALSEVRRVLRPGGRFHFLEHGLAPDARVAAFQRRVEPLQRRVADGCHLTRDPVALVADAGFVLEAVDQGYGAGPKAWSYLTRAVAVRS